MSETWPESERWQGWPLLVRGRMGGRPKALDKNQVKVAIALAKEGELTINEICEQVGCSRSTYYRQIASKLTALSS